jgi:peroxiredoxin
VHPADRLVMAGSATPVRPGDRAPSFSLRRTFEEDVELTELVERGPVVIAFYVFDFGDV